MSYVVIIVSLFLDFLIRFNGLIVIAPTSHYLNHCIFKILRSDCIFDYYMTVGFLMKLYRMLSTSLNFHFDVIFLTCANVHFYKYYLNMITTAITTTSIDVIMK